MKIITQDTKNQIINLIKITFLERIRKLLNTFLESIFTNFSQNRYISNLLSLNKDLSNLTINLYLDIINFTNLYFRNSKERKTNYYISKKNVQRTIVTPWGVLSFERDYYVSKHKNNGFFFIDKLFGFEEYKTFDPIVRALAINASVDNNINKTSKNSLIYNFNIIENLDNNYTIPRQTIYNWMHKWYLPTISYNTLNNEDKLYVMVDEKWIHEQHGEKDGKKHYIMGKCFVIFTGAKRKNKRTKLLNRHIFITSSKTPYKDLMDEICKIYDFEKVKVINLLSDAGGWILSGKDELKLYAGNKIVVNTCEFHVKQKIHRMTTDKELREKLINSIYVNESKKEFEQLADELIESKPEKRKEKLTEYKNYILKHWKSIINMKCCDIKSSMESHISHYVADYFDSRPIGFSNKTIEKYIKLHEAKHNGINILDLYLKTYDNDENNVHSYNEEEINFSIFDNSVSLLPVKSSTNPISQLINNIAFYR